MPYERACADISRDWHEVVRHLRRVPVGSPEANHLLDEAERLSEEYRLLSIETFRLTGQAWPRFPPAAL